ncbi:ABC transporter permease [Mycoplasma sp. OR1901]|uniref:ABC transporter permease n=1 Tax=Mycoplasma sp. OR1901 TaxID=2742195 RepID=UPI00158409AA|nr:ABC transporter permease subunit [Mycoplasma sp. OR1901]QKT05409.1 ABC transporter permease subunit [Mycoplasma sp. OR1901]
MISKIKQLFSFDKKTALFIPYLIIAILLILLPIIMIVVNAFAVHGSNFDSFVLIKDVNTWRIIGRSLWIGLVSAILCLIIGFPYAYFISSSQSKIFRIFALSLMISPMAIFTISRIYSMKVLALAVVSNSKSLNSELFMIFGLTSLNLPLMIMPLYTVFKDMPRNIIEASNDLGNNSFQTIFKVIIPYGTKAILSGLAMIFLASATTFIISSKLLTDGSQLQTIGELINSKINPGNKYDLSTGSALVIVVSAIFMGIFSLFLILPRVIFYFKRGAHYE